MQNAFVGSVTSLRLVSVYGGKWSVGPYVFQISNYFMLVNP